MGKRIKGPKPQLREWTLLFDKCDGSLNREKIIKDFASFWEDTNRDLITINGNCRLGGKIYGIRGIVNTSDYITGIISSVRRIERRDPITNRFPHDLMCAKMRNGDEYFFYGDYFSLHMLLMMGDMMENGHLNQSKDYYLHPKHISLGSYL